MPGYKYFIIEYWKMQEGAGGGDLLQAFRDAEKELGPVMDRCGVQRFSEAVFAFPFAGCREMRVMYKVESLDRWMEFHSDPVVTRITEKIANRYMADMSTEICQLA